LFAASAGNFDVIKSLLDAGADVLAVNRLKETVLHKCQKISRKIFRNCFISNILQRCVIHDGVSIIGINEQINLSAFIANIL
jgi:ankyrin repeat protein